MRLIDADKLLQELFNVDEEEWTTPEIRAILENAPTIITPTERTGEWFIREYECFTCDQCGEDVWNSAESTQEARDMLKNGEYPNYCPNCGAKMRRR